MPWKYETELPGETWEPIAKLRGSYEISNLGRVKNIRPGGMHEGRISPGSPNRFRYLHFNAVLAGKKVPIRIHKEVLLAFHGLPPSFFHVANHKDGNKANNSASNLEWVTGRENIIHAWENGLMRRPLKKIVDGKLQCCKCKEWKDTARFQRSKETRLGIRYECNRCRNKRKELRRRRKLLLPN